MTSSVPSVPSVARYINQQKSHYSKILIDDQLDAIILDYLFIHTQLYMFRAIYSPIIRSTWLYLQLLVLFTDNAADRCHG